MLTRLTRRALGPVGLAARVAGDLSALGSFARSFGRWQEQLLDRADRVLGSMATLEAVGAAANAHASRLIEVGEANAEAADEMLGLARENLNGNREIKEAMSSLDARMAELLRFAAVLEQELPAMREGLENMSGLTESARALSSATPPIEAAAARVDRIAGRIPGMRGDE